MSGPTPGEWKEHDGAVWAFIDGQWREIGCAYNGQNYLPWTKTIGCAHEEGIANARLMAAAKRLREALQGWVKAADQNPFNSVGFALEHCNVGHETRAALAAVDGTEDTPTND